MRDIGACFSYAQIHEKGFGKLDQEKLNKPNLFTMKKLSTEYSQLSIKTTAVFAVGMSQLLILNFLAIS